VETSAAVIKLNERDNILIALSDLKEGSTLTGHGILLRQEVPRGHKLASKQISKGENVYRYGQVIGQALSEINPGEHIHSHNLGMSNFSRGANASSNLVVLPAATEQRTFMGYQRPDGKAGTRNYIAILTSVNCAGSVARFIAEAAEKNGLLDEFPNVDGIVPIVHSVGCGMSSEGEGYDILQRTLTGYANHPNFGGVLLVGLGCEVMQVDLINAGFSINVDSSRRYMTIQGEGGTRRTIEKGLEELRKIAKLSNDTIRTPIPVSELVVGMQCGGSDGYSGITANPALGVASDLLVQHGGTSILSETSEIYGAEHLLSSRAVSQEVADKLMERIAWWENYCARNGGEMDNNPSPGNKRGGLTTILEKSLGASAKSGTAPLTEVYQFAEPIDKKGFVFMDSPGYDPCSVTGQTASGANLIVFTTGRGSVSGYKPSPGIKLATNTEMYGRMSEDMDINCGDIVSEGVSIEAKGKEIFELMIRVASGEQTKSEELGFGGAEFVPWQIGAVM
jgi:altronate dehydratase